MADQELEHFKIGIDLRAYAASPGYVWDRKESCRHSTIMRHPATRLSSGGMTADTLCFSPFIPMGGSAWCNVGNG
jgi:hypothetical protein